MPVIRSCAVCGEAFRKFGSAKTCSSACSKRVVLARQAAKRRSKSSARLLIPKICACGREFHSFYAKSCSPRCVRIRKATQNRKSYTPEKMRKKYQRNVAAYRERGRLYYEKHKEKCSSRVSERRKKITDFIAAIRATMPDLLKEFGL